MVRMIDGLKFMETMCRYCKEMNSEQPCDTKLCVIRQTLFRQPFVDADRMPKGKPGDYLEWDVGCGYTRFYRIRAICIYDDFVRYDIGEMLCPVVNHKAITRILTPEEMEKEIRNGNKV